jgi:hypothetical protein
MIDCNHCPQTEGYRANHLESAHQPASASRLSAPPAAPTSQSLARILFLFTRKVRPSLELAHEE